MYGKGILAAPAGLTLIALAVVAERGTDHFGSDAHNLYHPLVGHALWPNHA